MARSITMKQRLVTHLEHIFHVGPPLPKRPTLVQLQEWHVAAHERYLPHNHDAVGYTDGSHGRVVDISLYPPKNPSASSRIDRNWTLQVNLRSHIIQYIPLGGTFAGDIEGAKKAANLTLGYEAGWTPHGWGFILKETPTDAV